LSDSAPKCGSRGSGPFLWLMRIAVLAILFAVGGWWIHAQGATPNTLRATSGLITLGTLFFALLAASAFASSSETALFSLDKLDLSQMRGSGRWIDRFIINLLEQPNDTLITILILNNFFNIAAALTAAAFMDHAFGRTSPLTFTLAAVAASTGILLLSEILPKVVAHLNPQLSARILVLPLRILTWLLTPLRLVLSFILKALFALLNIPTQPGGEEVSEEELKAMISSGEVSSVLEEDEREMIDGVFELRRTVVAEILTPRLSVAAVSDNLTQGEMVRRLREGTHNRVLVYHETLDHLLGFLLVKEVLLDEHGNWREHLREGLLVPEGVGLLDLLKTFRRQRTKMAIVVDEYGGVAGIVTLQDLLEEIVGDIYEKHDPIVQEIQCVGQGLWRAAGAANLENLGEACGIHFPEGTGADGRRLRHEHLGTHPMCRR